MLKQLRWKFILINMILVTLVLTIVFAAVLAFSYRRLEMESTQAMERVLRSGNTDFPKREIGGGKPPNEKEPSKTMTAAFYVELNDDGAVKNVFGENVTVTNEAALDAIVANVLAQGRPSGTVRGENLRFLIQDNRIAFADRTNEIESLTSLLEASALVGFFGLLAFFGISLFLARWACMLGIMAPRLCGKIVKNISATSPGLFCSTRRAPATSNARAAGLRNMATART